MSRLNDLDAGLHKSLEVSIAICAIACDAMRLYPGHGVVFPDGRVLCDLSGFYAWIRERN